jgi:hypothetical protein
MRYVARRGPPAARWSKFARRTPVVVGGGQGAADPSFASLRANGVAFARAWRWPRLNSVVRSRVMAHHPAAAGGDLLGGVSTVEALHVSPST